MGDQKKENRKGTAAPENYQVIDYQYGAEFHVHVITGDPVEMEAEKDSQLAHWHTEMEIVCTFRGEAEHFIDGKMYRAHPGAVIVTNPCSLHRVIPDDTLQPDPEAVTAVVLHLQTKFLETAFHGQDEIRFTPVAEQDNEKLCDLFLQMIPYSDDKEPVGAPPPLEFEYLHIVSLIHEILYEVSKDHNPFRAGAIPVSRTRNLEKIRDAIRYVEEHYAEPITEAQIAERFYFSKEYFARLFKKNTNMTFMEFLTAFRISRAWEALVSTDRSVTDIALDCGFNDSRSFINAFKKRYGDTPLQYRKKRNA